MMPKSKLLTFLLSLSVFCGIAPSVMAQDTDKPKEELVWPNKESRANSDDWLRLHHAEIRQMRPRILVLNFVNGLSEEEARKKSEAVASVVRESSRYHGYASTKATPFLDPKIVKIVNLTDAVALPDDQRKEGNSSLYPRPDDWKEGQINFRYNVLFGADFAERYGYENTKEHGKFLNLSELVAQGEVNEVWFLANQGSYGAPFECTELKQAYNAAGRKIEDKFVQAGNGGSEEQPHIGRSLRILFINSERGAGCAMESLGHAIEGTSNSEAIPYFTKYFREYAGFDLKTRYKLPFDSFYGRNGIEFDYPTLGRLSYAVKGEVFGVGNYVPIGGNVHFTPSGRKDYDLDNKQEVFSTIEHYRLKDGEGGKDRAEKWTNAKFDRYRQTAPDCMGPWMVYWRQNMPGLDNKATDDTLRPMKNWWVFLYN